MYSKYLDSNFRLLKLALSGRDLLVDVKRVFYLNLFSLVIENFKSFPCSTCEQN